MSPLPRAACLICGAEVALRKGSLFREHKDRRHELYGTGQNDRVPVCLGSGLKALPLLPPFPGVKAKRR